MVQTYLTPQRRHLYWFLLVRYGVGSLLVAKYVERLLSPNIAAASSFADTPENDA
jgi:hypothetical protein